MKLTGWKASRIFLKSIL